MSLLLNKNLKYQLWGIIYLKYTHFKFIVKCVLTSLYTMQPSHNQDLKHSHQPQKLPLLIPPSQAPETHWSASCNRLVLPASELHINGIRVCALFCVSLLWLSTVFLQFMHVLVYSTVRPLLLLSSVTLHRYTTICFTIHWVMDTWLVSSLGMVWIMLLWTFKYKSFCGHVLLISGNC